MQNPFDMYSIQDIIFSQRPDLIIETGKMGKMSEMSEMSKMNEMSEIAMSYHE